MDTEKQVVIDIDFAESVIQTEAKAVAALTEVV